MWTLVLFVTTMICAAGWLVKHISCMAIIYYMETKGYKLPNDEEIRECTREVVKQIFKRKEED